MKSGFKQAETLTVSVGAAEVQPVVVSVHLKTTLPAPTPVARPALETVAIKGLEDNHVPPELGVSVVVPKIHIVVLAIQMCIRDR